LELSVHWIPKWDLTERRPYGLHDAFLEVCFGGTDGRGRVVDSLSGHEVAHGLAVLPFAVSIKTIGISIGMRQAQEVSPP